MPLLQIPRTAERDSKLLQSDIPGVRVLPPGPILETEVLVLDELGAQNPSSWVKDMVGYVVNYRYNENKVTILTTNYVDKDEDEAKNIVDPDSLSGRIGIRMRSRLFEMCKTIKMDGNDFRKAVKQAEHHF